MVAPTERERSFTARNGDLIWPEDHFLNPFVKKKAPPPPVPPFLLVHNLSPKDIAGSDITS